MTYRLNGIEIDPQPTIGHWMPRESFGVDGNGHILYSPFRQFEMQWELTYPTGTQQLQNFFLSVNNTGTVVADLPQFAVGAYQFYSYSGCILREPEWGEYFNEHITRVVMTVTKIRT